jgi:hypothetical protein
MDVMVATKIRDNFIWHNDNNRIYIQSDCRRNLCPRANATDTVGNITGNRLYRRSCNPDKIPATR